MNQYIIDTIIPIIFPVLFFGIFFAVYFYSNKKKNEALRKLSNCLTGSISRFSFMPTFNGEYQGLKFSILLVPGSRNSPAYLKISLIKNSFFKLNIYKESFLSKLGKKMGIVHEVKINDETFDREFLIFSNKPTQVINYLNNVSIKNAIRELFKSGFNAILISGKKLLIQKPDYNVENDLELSNVVNIFQKLSLLARGL